MNRKLESRGEIMVRFENKIPWRNYGNQQPFPRKRRRNGNPVLPCPNGCGMEDVHWIKNVESRCESIVPSEEGARMMKQCVNLFSCERCTRLFSTRVYGFDPVAKAA